MADATKRSFDYLMKMNIPSVMDSICQHLMQTQPNDPLQSIAQYVTARKHFCHGGVAVVGQNAGGGWLRVVDSTGHVTAEVDKLPLALESGTKLLAALPSEGIVVLALNQCGSNASASSSTFFLPEGGCELRRYSLHGKLLGVAELEKQVSCVAAHTRKGRLLVFYRNGGASIFDKNCTNLRDFACAPAVAVEVQEPHVWILTHRGIERRSIESWKVEISTHVSEVVAKQLSFCVGGRWVFYGGTDSEGNEVSKAVDFMGSPSMFVLPKGCVVAADPVHGGVWHLHSHGDGTATFVSDSGAKTVAVELPSGTRMNITVDLGSGHLWHIRMNDEENLLGLYDIMRGEYKCSIPLPPSEAATHIVSI